MANKNIITSNYNVPKVKSSERDGCITEVGLFDVLHITAAHVVILTKTSWNSF